MSMHTGGVADSLPSPTGSDDEQATGWTDRLTPIIRMAHDVWVQPPERRRLRAYGFRPAVEEGVLKREWHQLVVRISNDGVVTRHRQLGELSFTATDEVLRFNGAPFDDSATALEMADLLVSLINDYERWVEVREGRASRLRRTQSVSADRRPVNAIAETRRLQRMLGTAWGRPPTRRR